MENYRGEMIMSTMIPAVDSMKQVRAEYLELKSDIATILKDNPELANVWKLLFEKKYGNYQAPENFRLYTWLSKVTLQDGLRNKAWRKLQHPKKRARVTMTGPTKKRSNSVNVMIAVVKENFGDGRTFSTMDILPHYVARMEGSPLIVDAGDVLRSSKMETENNPASHGGRIIRSDTFARLYQWDAHRALTIEDRLAAVEKTLAELRINSDTKTA